MIKFNDQIEYCLPIKKPKSSSPRDIDEFIIKQSTHCEKNENGKYIIVFGQNACEKNIIELLNHEYLHATLGLINEDCARKNLGRIWYYYSFEESVIFKKILEEMSYSGIGYPTRARWIDQIRALYRKLVFSRARKQYSREGILPK